MRKLTVFQKISRIFVRLRTRLGFTS